MHRHNTRHSTDPKPPKADPTIWVSLDNNSKSSRSKSIFKKRVKQSLPKYLLILTEFAADGNKCTGANMRESVRHVIGAIALTI